LAAAPVMMKRPAGSRRAPWRARQLAEIAGWQGNDHRKQIVLDCFAELVEAMLL
jgi:hypothetical protein